MTYRDAIISQGMIRRQWRYEENGENITESRQLISSSGINAQSRRYSHQNRVTGGSIFSPNKNEQRISPSSKVHGSSSFFPNTDTRSSPLIMEGYSKPLTANAVQTASVPSSFTAQYSLQDGLEQKNGAEKLLPSSSSRILFDDVSPALTAAGDEKRGAPATTIALSSEIKESDHHSGDIQITGDTDARNMFKSMHTVKEASGSFKISGNFLAFAGGRKKTPQASPAIDAWTNKEVIEKKPVGELNSAVGTAHFMAPEIITDRIYDKSVDWWACGVTFYYCITKQHLFKGSDPNAIFRNILRGDPDLSKLDNNADLIPLKSLIAGFLEKDYKNRLGSSSTRVIKEHPFFLPSFQDICSQAPTLHPQQLEEVTVTQAERDAGEELFLNRKTVKRKVRVTTTSFSTTASGNLGSRRHKSSSKNKKSKKMSNMKRFNRVANSIRDYSIAETDENEDSGGDSHHYDSDAHNLDQSSVASRTEEGKILHEENDSNGIECDKS